MTFPPHVDVDVPLALRQRMGSLLADFDEYMRRRGKLGTRVPKRDGGVVAACSPPRGGANQEARGLWRDTV